MLQYDDIRYSITFARCHQLVNEESKLDEKTYFPDGAHEDPGPDDIDHEDDIDCDDDGHGDDENDQLPEEAVYADVLYNAEYYGGDADVGDSGSEEDIDDTGFDTSVTGSKGPIGKSFKGTVMHQMYKLVHLPPTLASYVLRDPVLVFVFASAVFVFAFARVCTNVASEAKFTTEAMVNISLWQYIWKMAIGYETGAKVTSCQVEWVSEFSRRLWRVK